MNTLTPTPRTDAAVKLTFAAGHNTVCPNFARTLERELTALTAERDQLRADCENETKWAAHYLAQSIADKSRAEKSERAETVALANWNGALERALKADAELATERARRDDLVADINDACITLASAKDDCDDYAMQNTGFKLEAVRDVLLQYIPNAAMKGGAK